MSPSEVKVVVDDTVDAAALEGYERRYGGACLYFAQPCMNDRYDQNLARTIELVSRRPAWRLSLQLHKIIGVA